MSEQYKATMEEFKNLGLTSDQIFQLAIQREKTRQLELELEIMNLKKRKNDDRPYNFDQHKKIKLNNNNSNQILCDDVWMKILEYLPNLDGFKSILICKQLNNGNVTQYLNRLDLLDKLNSKTIEYFMKSSMFKQIQILNFESVDLTNSLCTCLSQNCENLKELTATVGPEFKFFVSFKDRNNFKKLESLELVGSDIKFSHPHLLAFNLKNLSIQSNNYIRMESIINRFTTNIKHLNVRHCHLDLDPKIYLPKLETFQVLELTCNYSNLLKLFAIKSLKKLDISHDLGEEVDGDHFGDFIEHGIEILQLPHLRKLCFSGNTNFIQFLIKCQFPKLKELEITTAITEEIATNLAQNSSLSNLTHLRLCLESDEMATVCSGSYLKNVTSLYIEDLGDDFAQNTLKYIAESESFTKLKVLKLEIDNTDLKYLDREKFNNLEELVVNHVDPKSLKHFAQSTNLKLKMLEMLGVPMPSGFFKTLSRNQSFKQLKTLKVCLSDSDVPYLMGSRTCFKLEHLTAHSHKLTASGAQKLDTMGIPIVYSCN